MRVTLRDGTFHEVNGYLRCVDFCLVAVLTLALF
jgi:recombination DNA repair RAD52 pathway protein